MPSRRIETPHYKTILSAAADAPWIVMVHGVSQNHRLFDQQVQSFEADHRLILIDLPGHGLSSEMPGPYGLAEYASSIHRALDDANISSCHYWGTHLGAGAGLLLACQQPELFLSLILEGPVFPGRALPAVYETLAAIAATARRDGIAAARDQWWRTGAWFDVMRGKPDECRAAEHRALIDEFGGNPWLDTGLANRPLPPIDDLLAKLEAPILIVNGEHELPDFVEAADALEAILPNTQRTVIKDGGGFPLWEFPDRVNAEVARFLKAI